MVQATVPGAIGVPDCGVRGMSLPVLRETKMAAVVVEVGPAATVVEEGPSLAGSLVAALGGWAGSHWE
jgi:N-acetylmuramoyl-L-alanine amidase